MVRQVTAMITTPLSTPGAPDENFEGARAPGPAALQNSVHERFFNQCELRLDFAPRQVAGCDLLDSAVQISPIESVNRHRTGWHGMVTESIYAPRRARIEFRFDAPVHLLVMYDGGARRDGETSIDGLAPSRLRYFANKLTFVPADHAYHEWHETSAPTRVTYLYLDPAKLQKSADADAAYVPRIFFEDSVLRETATKLKSVIESCKAESRLYSEALANVLAHELSRSGRGFDRTSPVSRGGLVSWQMRAVTGYIEEHLDERISLATLARLARLSEYHFCRAFKRSFGIPPHHYHIQRRIERAKVLLGDRETSVTDIGLNLGYSEASLFTVAFRKATGQTPSEFRRNFT